MYAPVLEASIWSKTLTSLSDAQQPGVNNTARKYDQYYGEAERGGVKKSE